MTIMLFQEQIQIRGGVMPGPAKKRSSVELTVRQSFNRSSVLKLHTNFQRMHC